mmetsp:Transcript_3616/g.7838  ORF Transcript_3616/g.7838 Transcript_3616/m.7838 type:complete len:101 (-) Transcript_3616:949-1251(-)
MCVHSSHSAHPCLARNSSRVRMMHTHRITCELSIAGHSSHAHTTSPSQPDQQGSTSVSLRRGSPHSHGLSDRGPSSPCVCGRGSTGRPKQEAKQALDAPP